MMVLNAWYVAAWSKDVTQTLLPRTILNRPVVLYRLRDGTAVALENRCPHRNLPLSDGKLEADRIQCGYHGLVFDHTGRCVHIPSEELSQPDHKFVTTFPVAEKYGWLFVWMGDPSGADVALLPAFHDKLIDHRWGNASGTSLIKCGYRLVLDNLLDLSHVAYVHNSTNGNAEVAENAVVEASTEGTSVRVSRIMRDIPPAPAFAEIAGYTGNIDRWQVANFHAPSYIHIINGSRPAGPNTPIESESDTVGNWGFEVYWALTPETQKSTYGFWVSTYRKTDVFGPMAERFYENSIKIIDEDLAIYQSQQRAIEFHSDADDADVQSQMAIKADKALGYARRIIRKMHQDEQARQPTASG
jgi:phenylpropionate dioxygenase-like ring-hydroxylating dioxygenase large terminal subunit